MNQQRKNIVFIGMSGVGKSTIGKLLAQELKWDFIDIDRKLEDIYGMPLQRILDQYGNDQFVQMEAESLQVLFENTKQVLAPGGSIIYATDTMDSISKKSDIYYLHAPLATIKSRIEENDRGIVGLDGKSFGDLYRERESLYKKYSDKIILTENRAPADIVSEVIEDW